jgi:hypothetical protein
VSTERSPAEKKGEVSNPVRARAREKAAPKKSATPKATARKNAGGRPSRYSAELADAICNHIAGGRSLRSFCQADGAPNKTTVLRWLQKDEEFARKYALARDLQADMLADEVIDIADQAEDANIGRLKIDARKWTAAKFAPKKYGDKTELGGKVEVEDVTPPEPRHPGKDHLADMMTRYFGREYLKGRSK